MLRGRFENQFQFFLQPSFLINKFLIKNNKKILPTTTYITLSMEFEANNNIKTIRIINIVAELGVRNRNKTTTKIITLKK